MFFFYIKYVEESKKKYKNIDLSVASEPYAAADFISFALTNYAILHVFTNKQFLVNFLILLNIDRPQ